jgi:hypothetical protein
MAGPVISVITMLDAPRPVPTPENIERCPLFCASRSLATLQTRARACLTSFSIRVGALTTFGVKSTVSIGLESEASAFQRNNLLDATVVDSR